MKIVHINSDAGQTGGATIALRRIHDGLLCSGVESLILCRYFPEASRSMLVSRGLCWASVLFVWRVFMKVFAGCCHSTGLIPTGLYKIINRLGPDAVVLHWIQGDTISVAELNKINAPVFWFHHDLWPIRGITAHEWFKVPLRLGWLDRFAQWNKRRVAQRMGKRLIPVCASRWVADEIRQSGMYAREPLVISLPLDEVFKCGLRRNEGKKFRILNGARGGFGAGIKGGDRLLAAFTLIPENERRDMELVVFGGDGEECVRNGVPIRFVGRLRGEELAQAYRDADVFAFPSRQETFGQTKIEALACGTPVVVFDETACAEGIRHRENGWIAAADDIADYADGLRYFYRAWKSGCPVRVVGDAKYSAGSVAKAWIRMFEKEKNENVQA